MISHHHLLQVVIRPALRYLDATAKIPNTPAAQALMLGTALAESRGIYLRQLGDGPALGLWQVEPATERDVWENWLKYRATALRAVSDVLGLERAGAATLALRQLALAANLHYSCIIARLVYYRAPESLPRVDSTLSDMADAFAAYWKKHYNTHKGKGDPDAVAGYFEDALQLVCAPSA
jgi:hypothetical protein